MEDGTGKKLEGAENARIRLNQGVLVRAKNGRLGVINIPPPGAEL